MSSGLSMPRGSSGRAEFRRALKALRSAPVINAPMTYGVRAVTRLLGVKSEFAVEHLPHVGVTTMILPGGRRAQLWSRGDDWVSNQVFWFGWDGYEPEVTRLFWQRAITARVTLDIGAHVGFYSILAATANPSASVFAFEPLPAVFERLQRNLTLNRLDNVAPVRKAVGAADGTAEFFHVPGIVPCSSSLSSEFMQANERVESLKVDVTRLDTFLQEAQAATVDLMKIDTETTEPDVLRGAEHMLAASRPDIVCEVLPSADTDALTQILSPMGYSFYVLTDRGPRRLDRVVADPRWLNYLFSVRAAR